ncbi:MAG TPA: segregation/condensation protein A [Limnochordia bacterium]|jgi:segregation and condensation protein A|nr:segregation/condensation protein A [Limnochordia bacterium]
MGYVVRLEVYQGPFDLLLDLIAKNEVDILDIPIAAITEQYLEYLYSLQEKDLVIAGEFLVMAANLIRLKSRLLLPQEPVAAEDEQEAEDPRRELVEQLLRYKFFKEAAQYLEERYQAACRCFTKGQKLELYNLTPLYTQPVGDLTLDQLRAAYERLLQDREGESPVHEVYSPIPLQERIALVRLRLVGKPRLKFRDLIQEWTPGEIVGTFLAILELVRLGEIRVVQNSLFGEISIKPSTWELEVKA